MKTDYSFTVSQELLTAVTEPRPRISYLISGRICCLLCLCVYVFPPIVRDSRSEPSLSLYINTFIWTFYQFVLPSVLCVNCFQYRNKNMVKLSTELIMNSYQFINPVKDRELDLRGKHQVTIKCYHNLVLFIAIDILKMICSLLE